MELYLDTANVAEGERLARIYPLAGVTTNPSIIAAGKVPVWDVLPRLQKAVGPKGTLFAQTMSRDAQGMVEEAKRLSNAVPRIVVKIPVTAEGLAALGPVGGGGTITAGIASQNCDGAAALLIAVTVIGFAPTFDGPQYLVAAVGGLALGLALAWAGARWGWGVLPGAAAAVPLAAVSAGGSGGSGGASMCSVTGAACPAPRAAAAFFSGDAKPEAAGAVFVTTTSGRSRSTMRWL